MKLTKWIGRKEEEEKVFVPESPIATAYIKTYEELGLGGFWSTDGEGRITHLSDTLLRLFPQGGEAIGQLLLDVMRGMRSTQTTRTNLSVAMARRTKFTNVVIETGSEEDRHWWSMSAQARFDPLGNFLGYLGHCCDITSDRSSSEHNAELAKKDALTGLINRRYMSELLERSISNCNLRDLPCAMMQLDLDRFKAVNDTLGHSAGDSILKQVAQRLTAVVGDKERISRLGGDEFQIVFPEKEDRGHLGELARSIISSLSQPYSVDGNRCTIGASVGIAVAPFDGVTAEELVRNADLALYAAKHGGRGSFRFFSGELLKEAEERRVLEEDLRDALAKGELSLKYQPIVDANTNVVTGMETLIRWDHPELGPVSPSVFIPIAEETNLIGAVGEWTLRKACEDAAGWPQKLRVAVNISPIQFADAGLPKLIGNVLSASGLERERLEIEITEGVFLREGPATDAMFKALKKLGIRLALDDFGTGYSSLSYLKTAPFDKIKIDQSFVRGVAEEGSRIKAIIAAIVALADAVDMETTAEGIETMDQLAMIRALKVSHVQGYIYDEGIPNEDVIAHLTDGDWTIEPTGPQHQRHDRQAMYRTIGAVHDEHYYQVVLRNLSRSGAKIEGLMDVPVGTQFVLDFGEGQLVVATVQRAEDGMQGVQFETPLVEDGHGGLCTRHRVSPYAVAEAGLPRFVGQYLPDPQALSDVGGIKLPSFSSKRDWMKQGGQSGTDGQKPGKAKAA